MNRLLAHRGPDDQGIWIDGGVGLAHRRLSILDLSPRGHQPMVDRVVLTYNGEIFNYRELRAELEGRGHAFRSQGDTEVLLRAYLEWGPDCVSRFNGMWAFALWDPERRALFASRDRFGVKPFYYADRQGELIFASEPKALAGDDPSLRRVHGPTLVRFLAEGLVDDEESTFFEGIRRLPPASCLWADASGCRVWRYWTLEPSDLERALETACARLEGVPGLEALTVRPLGFEGADPSGVFGTPRLPRRLEEAARILRQLLADAVRLRLRSDVPVGTCLSGGLDSGSIVALASRMRAAPMRTFSSIYPGSDCDESAFVREVARQCGTEAFEVEPTARELPAVFGRIAWFQDEPTAGPGLYSQWKVMEAARGRVTVLLDGQGGDELLAGYHSYFPQYLEALAVRQPAAVEAEARRIGSLLGLSLEEEARRALRRARRPAWLAALGRQGPGRVRAPRTLAPEFVRAYTNGRLPLGSGRLFCPRAPLDRVQGDVLNQRLYADLTRHSIPGLLRYEDRNSMAFSLEARTPFLDYRLVEFCFALPWDYKILGPETKLVLRRAMAGWMPRQVVERRDKMGYPTPVAAWFRGPLRSWVQEALHPAELRRHGLLHPPEVEAVLQDHWQGRDRSWEIWRFLSLEQWLRLFIDGEGFRQDP